MTVFSQIAIGLALPVLIFAAIAIFRKRNRIVTIISGSVFAVAALSMLGLHLFYVPPTQGLSQEDTDTYLGLIYAIAKEGSSDLARELLRDLRIDTPDDAEVTLCDAYLRAASGEATAAKALYTKAALMGAADTELAALCDAVFAESKTDFAAAAYLNTAVEGEVGAAAAELKKHAEEQIKDRIPSDTYTDTAQTLIEAESLFDRYLIDGSLDAEAIAKCVRRLSKALEKAPALTAAKQVRVSRMKLHVLSGDYKEAANLIDSGAIYEELAVISELYLAGLVKESHFNKEYSDDFSLHVQAVAEQLKVIQETIPDTMPSAKRGAELLAAQLKKAVKDPALYHMKDSIAAMAASEAFADRAKAHLQLAKIEYAEGETAKAEENITASLSTVGMCEDDSFFVPMTSIVDIVTDKDDPEKLKNMAQYVDQVSNHSSDEMVVKALQQENASEQQPSEEEQQPFDEFMADSLSQTRISFDITGVDASAFETVKVTLNISEDLAMTPEELKEVLTVTDCGVEITNFSVEKVEFTAANILLCCDISGSMAGSPINDLREAVVKFVETSPEIENVALVTFSGDIEEVYSFGTPDGAIIEAAKALSSGGGTNMYDAIIEAIDEFSVDPNEVNYILLLSDGQDGNKHNFDDIYGYIGDPCMQKGIVLYSLGLSPDVDAAYMQDLATATGGAYTYVSDSATLEGFYDTLRNQILNRYVITFTAQDTLRVEREVKISHKDHPTIVHDTADYSLESDSDPVTDGEESNVSRVSLANRAVYGLDSRLIYKSHKPTVLNLKGSGFEEGDVLSAELDGALNYGNESVQIAYKDALTLSLTVPGGIACGEYDLRVTVNGKTAILVDELTVVTQGSEKTTVFGPYIFTSYSKTQNGDVTELSSFVRMNGWLCFEGSITLTGDLTALTATLSDQEGCFVQYNMSSATGYAATLASRCEVLQLGALGTVTLYNEPSVDPTADEYPASRFPAGVIILPNLLSVESPGMFLYPDRIVVDADAFTTKLPMQDTIIKNAMENLFDFEGELKGIVTNQTIGFQSEIKLSTDPQNDEGKRMVNFGKLNFPLYKGELEVKINTVANEFSIDFGVELPFLMHGDGVGLLLEWKARTNDTGLEKLCPTTVMFKIDHDFKGSIGPVPVTANDFKLGATDIDPNADIWAWKFKGSLDFGLSSVGDYIPGFEDYVGDVSLLMLDDTTLEFTFAQPYIGLSTELKFLEEIRLGKASIQAGWMPFTVVLLDMNEQYANGFQASLTKEITWEADNCDVEISGTGTLSMHADLFAAEAKGVADINIGWWIFQKEYYASGRALIGFYNDDQDRFNFAVIARATDGSGSKEYYLTWNKDTHLDVGTRTV